ncbi:flavin-containing monooxygenase [Microbacterium sediminis]|uniref:4-hydroxyacetophenone monooxygenase n=1 Tax=Microbacterium sediminis TaxID=904291 RepID=A0A1B9NE22_9MICO|nr:NAD(P)/FAD-dependent oxidoreductase [Microbacterium sediminis]OCG74838.1 4-hydroxyacetophenone monooxygenase [Microbacterium sediminis]QBR75140.1 NAD(P)/FAD-dependent oxidoreductase [Microbacterium sediminis]
MTTVIVGAGFAGIAAAIALARRGIDDVVILERADAVGGTWRDNTYPGVACDVPSHLYGLETHPWPAWSRAFAPGDEIRAYLEHVVRTEGLEDRLRLGTALTGARWDGGAWRVRTSADEELVADHLILACGRLTDPKIPSIPGLESFPGPLFHSARWRHDVPVAGRRVAVAGTGASAVQLVPELVRRGAEVVLLQRTPAWIVPRGDRPHTEAEIAHWRDDPAALRALRDELYTEGEARFASRSGDPIAAAEARALAQAHLEAQVPDPRLRAALTPDYAFGCRRVLLSDDFYPAIASGAARLVPSALAEVDGDTLVAADGTRHEADVLVLATGFEAARQPYARLVTGEHGTTLDAHWSGGYTAAASTLVPGFPNLFVLGGPNAALGHNSAVLILEAQAAFAAELVAAGRPIRVTPEQEARSTAEVDALAAGTPWLTGGCHSWYVDERSGRLTLLWPGTVAAFRERLDRLKNALIPVTADQGAS